MSIMMVLLVGVVVAVLLGVALAGGGRGDGRE